MLGGEAHVSEHIGLGVIHQCGQFRHAWPGLVCDLAPLLSSRRRVVLGEGGADPGGDDAPLGLAGIGERVAHEVHATALPGGPQNLGYGGLQPLVRVRDHQLCAAQAATCQRRNSTQKGSASLWPTVMPSTSRRPSALTPTATMTATETMWWSRLALT